LNIKKQPADASTTELLLQTDYLHFGAPMREA